MRRPPATALLLAALLPGCACDTVPEEAVTRCEARVTMGGGATDILFVVDDSLSMAEEQQNLHDNLAEFVNALTSSPVRNDFRIGLTNTSVEAWDGGTVYTQGPNDCAGCAPYPQGALVAVERLPDGTPITGKLWWTDGAFAGPRILDHDTATLLDDFQANVLVGVRGAGKEQPLRAARLALSERVADGTNAGFLRPGARLAVVILTDEDDCSDSNHVIPDNASSGQAACHDPDLKLEPGQLDGLDGFVAFLTGELEGERRDPIVAVVAGFDTGTLAPTGCADSYDDPTRLDALVAALGSNALKDSICRATFHDTLQAIASKLVPQTVPLEGAPPDPRMLAVSITKGDGSTVGCPVSAAGTPGAATAGAVYTPPAGGAPATLSFQNACVLESHDQVDIRVVCAG